MFMRIFQTLELTFKRREATHALVPRAAIFVQKLQTIQMAIFSRCSTRVLVPRTAFFAHTLQPPQSVSRSMRVVQSEQVGACGSRRHRHLASVGTRRKVTTPSSPTCLFVFPRARVKFHAVGSGACARACMRSERGGDTDPI